MADNIIKLNKDNILRLKIQTNEGIDTGEVLEFQLDDIELPLKYQELLEKSKKNREHLKNQITIIEKRQDVKGKKLLSKNQEDEVKALNDFFNKEKEVYNMFLGDNGVEKLLNGRKMSWTTLKEIDIIIGEQIVPYMKENAKSITEQIKEKYDISKIMKKDEEKIEVVE